MTAHPNSSKSILRNRVTPPSCAVCFKVNMNNNENKYSDSVRRWKGTILPQHEIRKTKKQKTDFIAMLSEHFGGNMHIEQKSSSRNIIIGDIENAKTIFTAHYDTCANLPFPNFITPMNFFIYIVYQLVITALILLPAFLLTGVSVYLFDSLVITELTMFVTVAVSVWLIIAGPANKHTANDNTSGVVTVLALTDIIGAVNNRNAAFVLFDNEEMGMLGSAAFVKEHKDLRDSAVVVNFDCVSDGDTILMTFTKKSRGNKIYETIAERSEECLSAYGKYPLITPSSRAIYPSDQANFRNGIAVAAMNKMKFIGYYVDKIHTNADTVFDENNIAALVHLWSEAV